MKGLGRAIALASAAACAAYTVIYLYRWEWHRAIVAALFLLVAEVALGTAAILRRMSALEQRLTGTAATGTTTAPDGAGAGVLQQLRENAPPPRPVFAWLSPDGTAVFLPILLGAGVLASAVAWVVEGLARVTARPVLERRLATRLTVLALPGGGLFGPAPVEAGRRRHRIPTALWRAGLTVVVVVALGWTVDELADATQTRHAPARPDVVTVVDLELRGELAGAAPDRVARSLWNSCAGTLRKAMPEPSVVGLGDSRFRLVVPVDLGVSGGRRVHGCLQDAAFDRVQAGVVTLRAVPTG